MARDRARGHQARDTRQGRFNDKGDLLFAFHRGEGSHQRGNLHLLIGDVWHGINGQALQCHATKACHHDGQEHEQCTMRNGELDDAF